MYMFFIFHFVDGAVRAVDLYTARDADLVEAAIRALVKR